MGLGYLAYSKITAVAWDKIFPVMILHLTKRSGQIS